MGVSTLISNKIDFKLKSIRRDGEGYFILISAIIHQNEILILNTLLNLKSYIKSHTLIVGDITPHSPQWTGQPELNQEIKRTTRFHDSNGLNRHLQNLVSVQDSTKISKKS